MGSMASRKELVLEEMCDEIPDLCMIGARRVGRYSRM